MAVTLVPDETPVATYTGDGIQTDFPYLFPVRGAADLHVKVDGTTAHGLAYTVLGAGGNDSAARKVVFTAPPSDGSAIELVRRTPIQRATEYGLDGKVFRGDTVNAEFAELYMVAQDINAARAMFDVSGTFAGRDAFDDERKGFVYYSTDGDGVSGTLGVLFVKDSDASADWSDPLPFQGPSGEGIGGGHEIQSDGTAKTQRAGLNFSSSFVVDDDEGNDRTSVSLSPGVGSGDMLAATYDPQAIEGDAFARANHTGTQTLSTISDAGTAAAAATDDFAPAVHAHFATEIEPGHMKFDAVAQTSPLTLNPVADGTSIYNFFGSALTADLDLNITSSGLKDGATLILYNESGDSAFAINVTADDVVRPFLSQEGVVIYWSVAEARFKHAMTFRKNAPAIATADRAGLMSEADFSKLEGLPNGEDIALPPFVGGQVHMRPIEITTPTTGALEIDPTADGDRRVFRLTQTLTGNLTITLASADQADGLPVEIIWAGANNSFNFIVDGLGLAGSGVFSDTGVIIKAYYEDGVGWRSGGVQRLRDQSGGGGSGSGLTVIDDNTDYSSTPFDPAAADDNEHRYFTGNFANKVLFPATIAANSSGAFTVDAGTLVLTADTGVFLNGIEEEGGGEADIEVFGTVRWERKSSTDIRIKGETDEASKIYGAVDAQSNTITDAVLAGATLTSELGCADQLVTRPELKDYAETHQLVTSSGGAATIDLVNGNDVRIALSEDTTLTFSNPPATGKAGSFVLEVIQDSTPRTITWPAALKWAGGTAPTQSTGSGDIDIYAFRTRDAGTTWYGVVGGQAFAVPA